MTKTYSQDDFNHLMQQNRDFVFEINDLKKQIKRLSIRNSGSEANLLALAKKIQRMSSAKERDLKERPALHRPLFPSVSMKQTRGASLAAKGLKHQRRQR